jgi:hypothetical protein
LFARVCEILSRDREQTVKISGLGTTEQASAVEHQQYIMRFIVHPDEKLIAFLDLEFAIRGCGRRNSCETPRP